LAFRRSPWPKDILFEDTTGKPYQYEVVNADLAKAIDLNLPTAEEIAERIAMMSG
jgi:hypothetical protein